MNLSLKNALIDSRFIKEISRMEQQYKDLVIWLVVRLVMAWCVVVWYGVAWCGVVWRGVVWRIVVCCGVACCVVTEELTSIKDDCFLPLRRWS